LSRIELFITFTYICSVTGIGSNRQRRMACPVQGYLAGGETGHVAGAVDLFSREIIHIGE